MPFSRRSPFSKVLLASIAGSLFLSGCAQMRPPAPLPSNHSSMNSALMSSVSRIERVTDNLRAAHGVAWHENYQGFPMDADHHLSGMADQVPPSPYPGTVSGPLAKRLYVQWSGKVNLLMISLAHQLGVPYLDTAAGSGEMDVSVHVRRASVLQILRLVAAQLPPNVTISLHEDALVLESD